MTPERQAELRALIDDLDPISAAVFGGDTVLELLDALKQSESTLAGLRSVHGATVTRYQQSEAKTAALLADLKALADEWFSALNMDEIYKHHAADRIEDLIAKHEGDGS